MPPETIFSLCNLAVLPGWLLLIAAPKWKFTERITGGLIIPAILAIVYVSLLLRGWGSSDGGFNSLDQVAKLFQNRDAVLTGWVHYLAFDLFVGTWISRDSVRLRVPHLLVVPCLVLTFLLGPSGLLLYLGVRWVAARQMLMS